MRKRCTNKNESGEVMIESTIVTIVTIMVLIFIIAIGFLIYQQVMMSSVAAETATSIARNYKFSSEDSSMVHSSNYSTIKIDSQYYKNIKLYRQTLNFNEIKSVYVSDSDGSAGKNTYTYKYVSKRLPLTSLGIDSNMKCRVVIERSAIGRVFVTVTVSMDSDTLWNGALFYQGMDKSAKSLSASSTAECLDITGYTDMVNYVDYIESYDSDIEKNANDIINDVKEIYATIKNAKVKN